MYQPVIQALASYASWANQQVRRDLEAMAPEEVLAAQGLSFTSIHGTLNHILVADRIWMARFEGLPSPGLPLDTILHPDQVGFWQARAAYDAHIEGFVAGLEDDWLQGTISYGRAGSPDVRTRQRWALLVHMFNHQTYHRGQIAAAMNRLGYAPPETDFPAAPWFTENPAEALVPR